MPHRLPFRSVTSRQNPIVAACREAAARPSDELVLIEGARLALEAVRAGWKPTLVAFTGEAREGSAAVALMGGLDEDTDCAIVPRAVIEAMSPAASPSGVVALVRPPSRRRGPFEHAAPLVLAACDVQDPGNLGAMARAAEAAGASGLLVCGASAHPFGWKALRGSMGSAFRLPIVGYATAADAIDAARARRLRIVALSVRDGEALYAADLRGPAAIFAGGEGAGLATDVVAAADAAVSIPMAPPVESLNVAVAAAVALYEAARQRSPSPNR